MSSKSKGVKVEVSVEQQDIDLTTYKVNITVATNDSIVTQWLAEQGAIDSISSYLTKSVIDYFHNSTSELKESLATKAKEKKLANKKASKKNTKLAVKEERNT